MPRDSYEVFGGAEWPGPGLETYCTLFQAKISRNIDVLKKSSYIVSVSAFILIFFSYDKPIRSLSSQVARASSTAGCLFNRFLMYLTVAYQKWLPFAKHLKGYKFASVDAEK